MFLDELKSMVESNEGYKLVTVYWYLSKRSVEVMYITSLCFQSNSDINS